MLSPPIFAITGYVRLSEVSFCMDICSIYYLEDEYGEFLSNVTKLDSIEVLNDYINRFVEVEGDTVQCVECEAINLTSIEISDDCQWPVNCFANPCEISECASYPDVECVANYCEGCWADYYLDGELINCDLSMDCIDLTGIDFGDCDMVLGIGWVNDNCVNISGCDWITDSIDYSNAFFDSFDNCNESCLSVSNDKITQIPTTFFVHQNYPNPFNPMTTIEFSLPQTEFVTIKVFNLSGEEITTIINNELFIGNHSIQWNGSDQPSGVYFFQIKNRNSIHNKKMVLLK